MLIIVSYLQDGVWYKHNVMTSFYSIFQQIGQILYFGLDDFWNNPILDLWKGKNHPEQVYLNEYEMVSSVWWPALRNSIVQFPS